MTSSTPGSPYPDPKKRMPWFYVWYGVLLLAVLIAGFSRTFFLRGLFFSEPLPLLVSVHGFVATSWFVLFMVQAVLVARRQTQVHRRTGLVGVVVVIGVLLVGVITAVGVSPRTYEERLAAGLEPDPAMLSSPGRWIQVARDSLAFVAFAGLAAWAFLNRHRPQVHKRLMILASVALSTAAMARVFRWPALAFIPEVVGLFLGLAVLIALPMIRDLRVDGRIHPSLKWGGPLLWGYLLTIILAPAIIFS
jgi:hypothetical protein